MCEAVTLAETQARITALEAELAGTRHQLAQLTAVVARSPAVLFVVRAEDGWPFEFISANVAQWGYAPDDFLAGRVTAFDIIHPDDLPRVIDETTAYAAAGATHYIQTYRALTASGEARWVEERCTALRDAGGVLTHFQGTLLDVTARVQAEAAQQESETRFRALIEHSADGLVLLDAGGKFLFASPSVSRINGYPPAAFMGQDALAIIHPEDLPELERMWAQLLRTPDRIINVTYRLRHADGDWRWNEATAHNLLAEPAVRAVVVNFRDVTAIKQAEEMLRQAYGEAAQQVQTCTAELSQSHQALQHSEEVVTTLLNASTEPIMLTDAQGIVLAANAAMAQQMGLTVLAAVGRNVFDFMPPSLVVLRQAQLQAIVRTGRPFHFEGKRGERILDTTAYPVRDADGRVTSVAIFSLDVTERRHAEQALARAHAFLQAALDILPVPVFFMDTEKRIFCDNAAMQALMRQTGTSGIADVQVLDPHTHVPVSDDRRPSSRVLRGELVAGEEYLLTVPATGAEMPVLEYAAPIYVDGTLAAGVLAIQDITALKEADHAKDEFLAVLSHELQTPLTAMLGWSDLALLRDTAAFYREAMEVVQRNARRQRVLIAEMLDMSRLLHRKLMIAPRPADLRAQARFAVANVQPQAGERRITVSLEVDDDAPLPVLVDAERIQQCLGNLLQNSLKFTPPGGRITVSCHREDTTARLAVRDTGRGIAPPLLSTLFDPFHQVDRDERAGGLGLGLAVTRGLIELHGGHIFADSPGPDQGSTFTITLPLHEAH